MPKRILSLNSRCSHCHSVVPRISLLNTWIGNVCEDCMHSISPSTHTLFFWIIIESPTSTNIENGNTGKWLLWVSKKDVDEVWDKIARATLDGILGIAAKVSTAKPNSHATDSNKHVICVYTYDYTNKEDVDRVRDELRKLGFTNKIPYKTDHTTLLGKYGKGTATYYE